MSASPRPPWWFALERKRPDHFPESRQRRDVLRGRRAAVATGAAAPAVVVAVHLALPGGLRRRRPLVAERDEFGSDGLDVFRREVRHAAGPDESIRDLSEFFRGRLPGPQNN